MSNELEALDKIKFLKNKRDAIREILEKMTGENAKGIFEPEKILIGGGFADYKEILLESINSIKFSDSYVKQTIDNGNAQTKQALALNASIQRAFDSYMSAWENRSKSYDIMSQKQSDAILGYERVYDTETNDIYKAYNGFTDEYDGERYKSITDNMYTEKTSGYIEK